MPVNAASSRNNIKGTPIVFLTQANGLIQLQVNCSISCQNWPLKKTPYILDWTNETVEARWLKAVEFLSLQDTTFCLVELWCSFKLVAVKIQRFNLLYQKSARDVNSTSPIPCSSTLRLPARYSTGTSDSGDIVLLSQQWSWMESVLFGKYMASIEL